MLWEIDFSSSCSLICQVFLSPRPSLVRQSLLTHSFILRSEMNSKAVKDAPEKVFLHPGCVARSPKGLFINAYFWTPPIEIP